MDWSTQQYTWINQQSFQIFSSGLGAAYATPNLDSNFYPDKNSMAATINGATKENLGPYEFPTGANYNTATYDDITSFSNGTMESAIP